MKARFTEHAGDIARTTPLLHDIMPIGAGETPVGVTLWRQADGRIRRVRADYPNGWRLQFSISVNGVVSRVRASCRFIVNREFRA
jgi:hypothetical protein